MPKYYANMTYNSFKDLFYNNLSKTHDFEVAFNLTEDKHEKMYNKKKYSDVQSFRTVLSKKSKKEQFLWIKYITFTILNITDMGVEELYNYIIAKMTPEQALMKLLKGSLMSYEKLKFGKDEAVNPEVIIVMAAFDLGWQLAIEKSENKNDVIRGIAVGTKEYMEKYFKGNKK